MKKRFLEREGWKKRWKQFLRAHDDFETIKNKVCSSLKGHIYITFFRGIFSNERYCCKQNPAAVWIEHQLLLKENNITKAMEERGGSFNMRSVSIKAMVSFIQKMPETNDKLVEVLTPALIKYLQMTSRHDQ